MFPHRDDRPDAPPRASPRTPAHGVRNLIRKLAITLGVMVFGLLLPILEIGPTHVFNADWPAHARLHEVWQLITNSSLAVLCLLMVWMRRLYILPSIIGLCVMGGVVIAHVIETRYGGALIYAGGPSLALLGVPAALLIPLVAVTLFGGVIVGTLWPRR